MPKKSGGFIDGPPQLTPGAVIDWHSPVVSGLDYMRIFDNLLPNPAWQATGTNQNLAITSSPGLGCTTGGIGLTGSANTTRLRDASNSYVVPVTGTFLFATTPNFDGNDASSRVSMLIGNNTTSNYFAFFRSGGRYFFGAFWSGVDHRTNALGNATDYPRAQPCVMGGYWDNSGNLSLWVNGVILQTIAWFATPTFGGTFNINNGDAAGTSTWGWSQDAKSNIHWMAFWNRKLDTEEMRFLAANPFAFVQPAASVYSSSFSSLSSAAFRRTFSRIGTRTSSRQMHIG